MNTPSWWQTRGLFAQLLRPASIIWQAVTWLRMHFSSVEKLSIPVWCVGNVTAGGGGKTPFCLYLSEQVKQAGINAYFIARGYGGSVSGPILVDPSHHTSAEVGDEALLLAKVLPTVVAHKRIQAAHYAVSQGAELLIMDDGLQYPHIHKDKIFLLLKGDTPLGNGYVIPAGPLREPLSHALRRSDIVAQLDTSTPPPIEVTASGLPIWQASTTLALPNIADKKVIGFAGIAYPELFRRDLEQAGIDLVAFHAFADHYPYTQKEIESLIAEAKQYGAVLITTQKDSVRILPELRQHIIIADQQLALKQNHTLIEVIQALDVTPSPH